MPPRKTKPELVAEQPTVCDCPCKNQDNSLEGRIRRRPVAAAIVAGLGVILTLTIGCSIYNAGYIDGMIDSHSHNSHHGYTSYYDMNVPYAYDYGYGYDFGQAYPNNDMMYSNNDMMMPKMSHNTMEGSNSDMVFIDGIPADSVAPNMMMNSSQ